MRSLALALLLCLPAALSSATVGGNRSPDGVPIQCDLPPELHLKNKGGSDGPRGPGSGSGLCVFTSLDMAAQLQNVAALVGFRDWMTNYPGGGWPEKVDAMVAKICKERGLPKPAYVQITNSRDLEILRLACRTGRMVCITYERSPSGRYGKQKIAHMVNLPHIDEKWAAVLDNNYISPPGQAYEWMHPERELLGVANPRGYWAVVLLAPPPSPAPRNR